jgi:hypothetical protein
MPHEDYFWAAVVLAALLGALFLVRMFLRRCDTPRRRTRTSSSDAAP